MKLITFRSVVAVASVCLLLAGCSGSDEGTADGVAEVTTTVATTEAEAGSTSEGTDMAGMDHTTDHVTELNGETPPGVASLAKDQEVVLRAADGKGHESLVNRTVRAPGTRAPIHIHAHGGTTCVIEGEMTLLIEGGEPQVAPAGSCYFMPPDVHMSGYNTGDVDAVMLDMFFLPEGEPEWVNLETA